MRKLLGKVIWWALRDVNVLANPVPGSKETLPFKDFLVILKDAHLSTNSRITAIEGSLQKRSSDGRYARK